MSTLALSQRVMAAVVAGGGQTDFAANFPALPVGGPYEGLFIQQVSGGVTTTLDLTAFSVVAPGPGGFTARLNTPATAGDVLTVYGLLPAERDIALTPGGAVLSEILEEDAMNLQAQLQEARRDLNGAVRAPIGETMTALPPATVRANGYLMFDTAGNPSVGAGRSVVAAVAIAAGQMLNLYNNAGTLNARLADYTLGLPAHAFALAAAAPAAAVPLSFTGLDQGLAGLTPGPCWLGAAGAVLAAAPVTIGQLVQQVGVALDAATLAFQPQTPVQL